ncbi:MULTISPECIES: ParA family protein [spotted fever group]|uniref:Plasmid partitioning protein ParA n=1 Tax=Rickettsia tamurae subsp. buchneri TaxID=1462938 RepID=A0A8E0WKY3_9RICK|nr:MULTISPECIES: ParA family protein [spotted fever group]EER20867.1 ParA1 [Rickettsia endosymbiont of Ixodes scapularis]KDO02217.1 Plasmid partitioning protein ParA [Rickettsia tamurae subsp. buchneri]
MSIIVAFISQKGGVGKSTLSRALARELSYNKFSVKIADLDVQQGTCIEWNRIRLHNDIKPYIPVEFFKTAKQALEESKNYDVLIIDGPARTSVATLEIAKMANLVIQPSGASVDDLLPAIKEFHGLIKNTIPKSRLAIALNRIGTPAEAAEAIHYIQDAGYNVFHNYLHDKPSYRKAQNLGFSITETKYKALNEKADSIIQDIIDRITDG